MANAPSNLSSNAGVLSSQGNITARSMLETTFLSEMLHAQERIQKLRTDLEAAELKILSLRTRLNTPTTSGRPRCDSCQYTVSKAMCIATEEIVDDSEEEREESRRQLFNIKRRPIKKEATITASNLVSAHPHSESESSSGTAAGPWTGDRGRSLFRGSTWIVDDSEYNIDPYHTACADLSSLFKNDAAPSSLPSASSRSASSESIVTIRTPSPTAFQLVPAQESPTASQFVFVAVPDNS